MPLQNLSFHLTIYIYSDIYIHMKTKQHTKEIQAEAAAQNQTNEVNVVNALAFRQAFGAYLDKIANDQVPLIIEKNHKKIAVLIPIETYEKRFYDLLQEFKSSGIIEKFKKSSIKSKENSTQILRNIRYGKNN